MQDTADASLASALDLHASGGAHAERAANMLFRTLWPKFKRTFTRWGLADGVAEEVASDAVLKVLLKIDGLRDPVAFVKWSNTVARNTFLTHLRDTKSQNDHEVFTDAQGWELLGDRIEDASRMDPATLLCLQGQLEAFCRDHPQRAMVLEHCVLDGWSQQQVAQAIERNGPATKEFLSQCKKRLLHYWQQCFHREAS